MLHALITILFLNQILMQFDVFSIRFRSKYVAEVHLLAIFRLNDEKQQNLTTIDCQNYAMFLVFFFLHFPERLGTLKLICFCVSSSQKTLTLPITFILVNGCNHYDVLFCHEMMHTLGYYPIPYLNQYYPFLTVADNFANSA